MEQTSMEYHVRNMGIQEKQGLEGIENNAISQTKKWGNAESVSF